MDEEMKNVLTEENEVADDNESPWSSFVQRQVQCLPWWLISIVLHTIILCLSMLIAMGHPPATVVMEAETGIEKELKEKDEPPQESKKPEVLQEQQKPIEQDAPDVKDPIIKEAKVADHVETADNQQNQQALGDPEANSDSPLLGKFDKSDIGIGGRAAGRFGSDRLGGKQNLVKERGGSSMTEEAVNLGLDWLKRHQNADGSWDSDGFTSLCGKTMPGMCEGNGEVQYDPAMTGLALLCFLGAGHTTTTGNFQEEVRKALQYLQSIQDKDGCFGPRNVPEHMYNHAIATFAMVEAYALSSSNPLIKPYAQKGIDFLLQAQTPNGGWRYTYAPGNDDASVMGWCVMALKFAKVAGLEIPAATWSGARSFLDAVTDPASFRVAYRKTGDGLEMEEPITDIQPLFNIPEAGLSELQGGQFGPQLRREFTSRGIDISSETTIEQANYRAVKMALCSDEGSGRTTGWTVIDHGRRQRYLIYAQQGQLAVFRITSIFAASESMTAVAMTARIFMDGSNRQDQYIVRGADLLAQKQPQWGEDQNGQNLINYYYWYHGTLAMYQMGGDQWLQWNDSFKQVLLAHQEKEGCRRGSWPSVGRTSKVGGRIYVTALSILSLEIYYRYAKLLN